MDVPDPLTPTDERRHGADLGDRLWNESWYLDWAADDGSLGGYVRLSLYPALGVSWFWACVVGEARPLVTAINHRLPPLPEGAAGEHPDEVTVQQEGLRCRLAIEEPFQRFSASYETTATSYSDPREVFGAEAGEPAILAAELVWETDAGVYPYPGVTRYEVPCRVQGTVYVGDEGHRVEAFGERDHSWGHRDWWSFGWVWTAGRLSDGTAFHATEVRAPGLDFTPGFLVSDGVMSGIDGFAASEEVDDFGVPTSATMGLDRLSLGVTPVAHAPVRLEDPEGRVGRLQRALCRFETADDTSGFGWTEWNQPPASAD